MSIVIYRDSKVSKTIHLSKQFTRRLNEIFDLISPLETILLHPYHAILGNRSDLYQGLRSYAETNLKEGPAALVHSSRFQIHLNRLVQNYLSSFRYYVDVTPGRIDRQLGEFFPYSDYFKELTRIEYDANPSYRFLYKFRNFTTHYSSPIERIDIDLERVRNGDFRPMFTVSRDELMNFGEWGGLRAEIENLPSQIEVIEHIDSLHRSLNSIYKAIICSLLREHSDDIAFMLGHFQRAVDSAGDEHIALLIEGKTEHKVRYFPVFFCQECLKFQEYI